ncbi:MAG: pyridoxal-phosphate dependent enzyme [bacterium]|nr:pyridoxal-phosphate dependent enzyme [Myxococcales bacterium]
MIEQFRDKTRHAAELLSPVLHKTPLTWSAPLSEAIGGAVYLKQENLQRTHTCKARSAYYMLATLSEAERRHVVTVSTGNNGVSMSWAMSELGIPGTVFLPHGVVPHKVAAIARHPITIIHEGDDIVDAEIVARAYAREHGYTFRSPYNEWGAMIAQATIADEIFEQLDAVGATADAFVVPVGGGGLIAGIAAYLLDDGRKVELIGAQPEKSPVMALSVRAGRILQMPSAPTLSDATAGGVEQGAITFAYCRDHVSDYVLLSEDEIADAMVLLYRDHDIRVEGSGALSVATLLKHRDRFRGKTVVLLACGANVDDALLERLCDAR